MRIDIEGEGQGEHEQNSLLEGTSPQSGRDEIAVISSPTTSNISPNTIALKEAKAVIKEANETKRLLKQFKEIRDLCQNDIDANNRELWIAPTDGDNDDPEDVVDSGGYGTISIAVLKILIGRMETDKNAIYKFTNIIPVGGGRMNMPEERERVYDVLTKINNTDSITFEKFQEIVKTAEAADVTSMEHQIVTYFEAMEKGKKIVRWPPPIFIPIITIVQFVLFFVNSSMSESLLEKYLQFDTDCIVQTWWSYLTYSLLHVGEGHLIFNLVLQLGIGLGLEMVHGSVSVLLLYTLGVLAGSLSFFCFDCGSLLGASGGLYSLIAASFSTCVMNWNEDVAIFMTRFRKNQPPFAVGGKLTRVLKITSIVCFFAFDFGYAAYRSYHDIDSGYSVVAHIGGTVTGLLLGFILLKDVKMQRWEKLWKVVCASLFFFLIGLAFGVNLTGSRRATGLISSRVCPKNITDCALQHF